MDNQQNGLKRVIGLLALIVVFMSAAFGAIPLGIKVFASPYTYEIWLLRNNIKDGNLVDYHAQGVKKSVVPYVNGKSHGLAHYYNEEGKLTHTTTYRRGRTTGVHTSYYPNGKIKERGTYHEGQRMGTWNRYKDNGAPDVD